VSAQREKLRQKSAMSVVSVPEDMNGVNSNPALMWCHRDYKRTRLIAFGDSFNLISLIALTLVPFALFLFICPDLMWWWIFSPEAWFYSGWCYIMMFLSLPTFLILASGFPVLYKPQSLRMTQRGLEIRQMFGIRQVPWQKVTAQFDLRGNLQVAVGGKYKFVVKDDYEEFEQLREDLITFADLTPPGVFGRPQLPCHERDPMRV